MSSNPGGDKPDPSLRPTSISVLVVAGLAAAAIAWLLLSSFYYTSDWPRQPWVPIVVIATLAIGEGFLAQNTAARVQRKPGAPPVEPLAVARYVVLAKASSLAGALYAGYSGGVLAWLALEPTEAAGNDIPASAGGTIAALALVGAALWLERSCRIPDKRDRQDDDGPQRPSSRS
ncbi:DUF3180 domain-containing protein [Mangrovihabitans endophyticus]|uniref:DUF3180 domain-containing protein n=1 Tax=Mangrovihabitans endophyticus TaxID=1751298 RepID=A0A8J3C3B9_9ACTN|nr:DUF3180 domain-containing protein [Mangrovihabitans endophyticus]GGL03249.1 hypothetical protein GCM10012284_42340 [Mangrovihabitans endophyticus]